MLKTSMGLCALAVVGVLSLQYTSAFHDQEDCRTDVRNKDPRAVSQTCTGSVNWFAWVSGKSRSAQFHFLDLLELTLGKSNDKNKQQGGSSPSR
ncbi:hypothetical protein [Aliidiomarina indica]|uniref:hypothetical protein n=1 Tax=Aliidiomarina indica TaxID=2749147 RepID=UPI001890885D|nr:hypothetical protein [Aliidiomarina indica]